MADSEPGEKRRTGDLREGLNISSERDRRVDRVLASTAWVTPLLMIVNVVVFVAMAALNGTVTGFDPLQLALWGGNSGALDLSGQWWRLLTYQFLHANLLHIVINMWVMWYVGRLTERLYGSITLLYLYLAAGALAGLASIVWNPAQISVGASGSIFGVLGALVIFLLRSRDDAPTSVQRYWFPALAFTLYNLIAGAYERGVDNAAHVGGFTAGIVLGAILARPLDARRAFPIGKTIAALLIAGACALPPLHYLGAFAHRPSTFEAFVATHRWYFDPEGGNVQLWQSLAAQMNAGTISNDEVAKRFNQDILPFWKDADARLQRELQQRGHDEDPFLPHLASFANLRLTWANAITAVLHDGTPRNTQVALYYLRQTSLELAAINRLKLRSEAETLPAPLSENSVVIWLRDQMPGLQRHCIDPPSAIRASPSLTDAANDGPAERHAAGCAAQQIFMMGDYATLDATLKTFARNLSDLPDGTSRLEGAWAGLDDMFNYGTIPVEEALRRTAEWRRSVRGSAEPDLVETLMFRAWAYGARGHGFASSITPQAMELFVDRTAMAAASLHETASSAAGDPMWYVLSLGIDRDQSVPADKQRATFDSGASRFPAYLPLYRQMLVSLMPRWGGSTAAVESFIRDVSKKGDQVDPATYARLYLIYGDLEGEDFSVIESANADKPLLKEGLEELRTRYRGSDFVLNAVAHVDCIANDVPAYQAIRPQLNGHNSATAWSGTLTVASCDQYL